MLIIIVILSIWATLRPFLSPHTVISRKQLCICNPQLSLSLPTDGRSLPDCQCISTGILSHQFLSTGLILRVLGVCTYIMV